MKLKMLTTGPNKNYRVGQVVEVDEQRAAILLKGKHAQKPGKAVRDGDSSSPEEL